MVGLNVDEAMILVFKTSLQTESDLRRLAPLLDQHPAIERWTVDLEDCDNVLRIVAFVSCASGVIVALRSLGYYCAELED